MASPIEDGKGFATSATYIEADGVVVNAFISEKVGTTKDQMDMMRMGKQQQLKVIICSRTLKVIYNGKSNCSISETSASCPCLDSLVS